MHCSRCEEVADRTVFVVQRWNHILPDDDLAAANDENAIENDHLQGIAAIETVGSEIKIETGKERRRGIAQGTRRGIATETVSETVMPTVGVMAAMTETKTVTAVAGAVVTNVRGTPSGTGVGTGSEIERIEMSPTEGGRGETSPVTLIASRT